MAILEARQYDENFLVEIIDSGDQGDVHAFFQSHQGYVKKTRHLIEFVEVLREKLEIHYGYKPSWEEIFQAYKSVESSLEMPKEEKKWIKNFLK